MMTSCLFCGEVNSSTVISRHRPIPLSELADRLRRSGQLDEAMAERAVMKEQYVETVKDRDRMSVAANRSREQLQAEVLAHAATARERDRLRAVIEPFRRYRPVIRANMFAPEGLADVILAAVAALDQLEGEGA